MGKFKSLLLLAVSTLILGACGSGSSPLAGTPKIPDIEMPPTLPDFQGGSIQISNGYKLKGTLNDVVEPQVTKSGYTIYGGVQ